MEIKKNYELHKFGNKIVLLGSGLCPSPTGGSEWKTKVLLEADELIAHSEVRLSANDTFFIMRVGENFAICRDIDGQMYVSPLFKRYMELYGDILLLQKRWSRWTPLAKETIECFGMPVLENFDELFLRFNEPGSKLPYTLRYYEDGKLVKREFKECVQFCTKLENKNAPCHCNVMKVLAENGESLWLSIKKKYGASSVLGGQVVQNNTYNYIFTKLRYSD